MLSTVDLAVAELVADAASFDGNTAVLVAGQALALWGEHYGIEFESTSVNPLASKDVDFFEGRKAKIEQYIEAIRSKLTEEGFSIKDTHWAKWSDSTPEVAKLILVAPDRSEIVVDFLGHVAGLSDGQIKKKSISIQTDAHKIRVLHPIECLKARIYNLLVLYPKLISDDNQEKFDVEVIRVQIALEIVHRYFLEELSSSERKEVTQELADLCRYGRSRLGKKLMRNYQLSIADAFPESCLPSQFKQHNYDKLVELHDGLKG